MSLINQATGSTALVVTRASTKLEWDGTEFVEYAINAPAYRTVNGRTELSFEPAETNLFLRSADPSNAAWTRTRLATPVSAITAPDGTTAVVQAADATTNSHLFSQVLSLAAATEYTFSFFAKEAGLSGVLVEIEEAADPAVFRLQSRADLLTGAWNNRNLTYSTATAGRYDRWSENYGDGWYRWCIRFTTNGAGNYTFRFSLNQYGGVYPTHPPLSFLGNGTDGVAFWVFQITPGKRPGSPIITAGSTVTRAADQLLVSGAAFSKLGIRSGATIRVEAGMDDISGLTSLVALTDGSANNAVVVRESATRDAEVVVTAGGTTQATLSRQSLAEGESEAIAARVATNSFAGSVGDSAVVTDASVTMPALTQLRIGADAAGTMSGGTIKRITIWPSSSDAQVKAMSAVRRRRIRVILAGGQSNAVGNGQFTLTGFPEYFRNERVDGVQAWNGTNIVPLRLDDTGSSGNGRDFLTAPSISYATSAGFLYEALRLYAVGRPDVVLCQITAGGTPLAPRAGFNSWSADYDAVDGARTALTEELENRWEGLVTYCAAESVELVPVAMVWHQGETDNPEPFASQYGANLTALINHVRTWTGLANLPWISGTVPATSSQYSANVRAGMLSTAAALSYVNYRDNDDLSFHDGVHFTAASWLTFGTWVRDRLVEINP